jgi:hypothetical protein
LLSLAGTENAAAAAFCALALVAAVVDAVVDAASEAARVEFVGLGWSKHSFCLHLGVEFIDVLFND